ncbi:MAG: FG-GAP repeat domain-containing protein [Candidatus Methylomirabilales bacterium]
MKATPMKLAISLLLVALTSTGARGAPVSSLSSAADEAARQVAEAYQPVQGKVLSVLPDQQVLLDITAEQGAYVGMEMEVFREGHPFKHPVTGEVLGRMDQPVGTVRLVEIQPKFSLADRIQLEPGQKVQQGDGVRVSAARLLIGLANVTASSGYEDVAQRATRDIAVALRRTGRFEVIDERRMRSTLVKGGVKAETSLRDPAALKLLRKELRISALALPHLSEASGTLDWDVSLVSTTSGRLLRSVNIEVASNSDSGSQAAASAPAPEPTRPTAPQVAAGEATPAPAWIGPPSERSSEFLAVPYAGIPSARLVLGPEVDTTMRGIAVADFDGDGRKEVAVAEPNRITIFSLEGKKFRQLWSSKGRTLERWSDILALDAADINGNGVAELFVSSRYNDLPNSYVLERQDEEWVLTQEDLDMYFRVLPDRRGRPTLYAQTAGINRAWAGGVYAYAWRNGRYESVSKVKLPRGTYIYNFALGDVQNNGRKQVIQIANRPHRLRVYSGGKLKSQPGDRFGGSGVFFDWELPQERDNMISAEEHPDKKERYFVHPPLVVTDLDGDGKRELVAVRNLSSAGYIVKNFVLYDKSRVVALRWGGVGFQVAWETQELEGYVSDFFLGDLGDGGDPVLVFALVKPRTLGLRGAHSGLFVFRLARSPGETQAQAQESKSPRAERGSK